MAQSEIHPEVVANSRTLFQDEYEHVPLKQRLKMLLATHSVTFDSAVKLESDIPDLKACVSPLISSCLSFICGNSRLSYYQCPALDIGFLMCRSTIGIVPRKGEIKHSNSQVPPLKVEESVVSLEAKSSYSYSLPGIEPVKFDIETGDQFRDELDHVVLKERLRWLLTSIFLVHLFMRAWLFSEESGFTYAGNSLGIPRRDGIQISEKVGSRNESECGMALLSGSITPAQDSTKPKLETIKVEPPNWHEVESSNVMTVAKTSANHLVSKKEEVDNRNDLYEAELDHMLLRDRMNLLSSENVPHKNIHQNAEDMSSTVPSLLNSYTGPSKPMPKLKVNRPRKRRKTVTDSIEIAMEEDAPGLLQVLIEIGVSLNEIKLYGESESEDALDDSSTEDNFSDLEEVISKIFMQRESFLKFGPLRCGKGEKASYCLACLFSLVEQARYLQFRNWPVEWGWCRDLQSFIFVFERHNRIVLERPEYGYATYFFELAASLPIHWQIKRLVTSMKLTSCGRVTLLENKALMVGEDLTEGEARVLMEFGWIPNTGLGTMLNYFDRVVHDRKSEKYSSSEWSSKIGKLLVAGYNGGTIIPAGIPENVMDHDSQHSLQVKLEPDWS
ncbi:hypothetical protein F511_19659 [Dorcoceras hygrometricum]|uniref:Uncharacterized protein n=1 Tax=Dorcoceras hygrometricum TaxID=472368 RepID=A0A2Z7B7W6_9LAMI|nr:hypothetical protein F511_19659 [Dorcoceras hygrometricum]